MKKIFTIVFFCAVFSAGAQNTLKEIIRTDKGVSKHDVQLNETMRVSFNPSQAKEILGLDAASDLVLKKQESDKAGFTNFRYYQMYKGYPVENSMYIVHTKNGKLLGFSGSIITEFDNTTMSDARIAFNAQNAVSIAINKVNAKLYAWQDAGFENAYKKQMGANETYTPKATLVWFSNDEELSPRNMRLAYKIDIYARVPLSRADYFIDAATGEYLGKKDKLYFSDATGTAATAYSGSQTIHSDLNGSTYRLRDYTKGNGILTYHGESGSRGTDYTSTSSNWSLSGTNIAALDAHYGVSQTYAFYYSNFGRNSYDNAGTALVSYVNDPTYTDNAFWDGTAMNFNKRSNSTTYPGGVTGIDVTGHELTHGVTQEESALNYSKEPGAMNESMSDIMGKSVQFWSKPSDINWILSNDMNWAIRSFSNPNAYSQPDTYKGTYWKTSSADNYGVHTNSGVGNFMFYLLVTGGSGTNDIGNSYSVSGIGITKAYNIIYRTNTTYLVSTSKYADWRTACINAATDLYGASSNEVIQVENAWYAVGVGTAGGGGSSCNAPTSLTAGSVTNTSALISWSAASGATSYTLQWKAASASTWTTVTGITSASYSLSGLTAGTSYNVQLATVCSAGTSAYTTAITFAKTGGTIAYCTSKGSSTGYEYINKVVLGSISNTSGNNNGYKDYTSLSTSLAAGSSYAATLTPGFVSGSYREYWTLWIDYNGDGDFTDAGEKVGSANGTSSVSVSFTVPSTAKNGATRIRVQMSYGSATSSSCATFSYGEVEDYTASISGGSGFAPAGLVATTESGFKNAITIAPNPVAHMIATINYGIAREGKTALRIVDMYGRSPQVINFGHQQAGTYTYRLPISGRFIDGAYFIILEQNGKALSHGKLIVIK